MKPAIVMPLSDPKGMAFEQLARILPQLKAEFDTAIVSIPRETRQKQADRVAWLRADSFFELLDLEEPMPVGVEFLALYRLATQACHPQQTLHLCFIDRVAFGLQSRYREQMLGRHSAIGWKISTDYYFKRSSLAWQSHPANYRRLEQMVDRSGRAAYLAGRSTFPGVISRCRQRT